MFHDEKGLQTFCSTLKRFSETLEQTPRRYECVPLLSELAGYVHQFTPDAKLIVELFAGMATRWAENLKQQYEVESSTEKIAAYRQKECILYGFALLAYTLGEWDDDAAQSVCKLVVLFRTSFLCASINVAATDDMLRVESRVAEMMSRRITELIAKVETIGSNSVLTALVRLVSSTCPYDLEWKHVGDRKDKTFGSCFEDAEAYYAVNLFTGVVLTDGNAPGGPGIREHERYLALFGRCNLETGEELFIQELTVGAAGKVTDILQLCSAQWIQTFSTMFPVRLQELYSHWYWEEKNCILFRPKEAKNRKVLFVARFDESGALHCYKVPFCDWELLYQEILDKLDNYDRFVQKESLLDVLQVLTKFEDKNFLHPLKSPEGMITIELPRFQLAFCLNSNQKFESVEHKGYILAINQQFDDFLTRHSRYLVLELQDKSDTARPKLRMLLPVGSMREDSEGMVDITIPDEADSLVVVACYDVHRRLKTLETETISARLQLAAICTRAGTNVPCKRLQMTGAEAAVQMLRACRFTHHATTACPRILATCFMHQQTHNYSQALKRIPLPTRPPSSSTGLSRFFRHPRRHQSHHSILGNQLVLINRPGTVCQLNIGRGKTRVILPMLFLHFAHSRDRRVVRVHFLGSLLSEACQYMHRYLSASTSQLCIFELPFHRWIGLDIRKLELIHDVLQELKAFGGIQVVAPEHRMSLELKRFELDKDDEVFTEILDEILDNGQYIDVLDECDAVLHHKYHLVYAAGHPIALSNGVERWQVAEAVLGVIASKSSESRVAKVLQAPHVSCSTSNATPPGACKGTRLNTVVDSTEPLRKELKKALALDLIDNSELMWLNMLGKGVARDSLITAITDSTVSLQTALGEHMQKLLSYINQLLALRGLIAFGVLEHCLEKRYRVNFGLPLPDTRPKKIAIPFRAADVPSEQSEFSHPDVCIALTLLGYYHRGLSDKEVQLTFEKLLRLDISEQIHQYDRWYASFKTLCNFFRFCMETINFFLNTDVFPKDTQQYPQRLSRTAWGIAAGGNNIGFSGTNDNHRLLPLSVTQLEPVYPLLLGTNGDMLHKIMQESHGYEVVGPSLERSQVPWQSVLLYALGKGVQALIDTGALLAGVMNHKAAEFLLERSDFAFAGVTYFHNRNKTNCWVVAEKDRRLVLPLKESSMLEKDTFVIFDEARSRGSDMKLPPNASAVLTLGPRLTKDKLMQGAGRMRQLGRNQTLWIASFDEVAQSILQAKTTHCGASDLTAVDVLNWVVDNTKAESVNGLLEWAGNGFHYQKTQYDQKEEWVPEDWSLEMLYQEKLHAETITHIIESKARSNFEGIDDDVVSQIRNSGRIYGLEDEVCVTAHTDECERELEVEEKVQEQQNLEVAHCSPAQEKTWNYAEILRVQSIEELDGVVRVYALVSFIRQWIYPKTFADLAWSTTHIFGTENFFSTVLQAKNEDQMNEYLRFIDVILVFVNGQVLLVSECEADHILQLLWSSASCSFRFVNLAFAWDSVDELGSTRSFRTSTWL
ncbi:hypothetical protein PC129_g4071 [Phytophthora cactorum]|uniref:ubiquitinyl hydrolase 1 n=1 Tax=Phytophthora cactorum TaxID=29920 RepID=A0A8T1IJX9_9STRA|nr:hypothetical protein PC114_g6324 [Phytophthora cactorum]KAG3225300.1 hypothetical protein PC129_g4071 [Phytophthora cactorum]